MEPLYGARYAACVANCGDNKGQLTPLVEAICRDFRQHDKEEENKYQSWQKLEKTKGSNKDKPDRDKPGERLFMQLQQVLPSLEHHRCPRLQRL